MTEAPRKAVFLAGTSPAVRDVLKDILARRGVRMCELQSVNECCESLTSETCGLVVVGLDGDAKGHVELLARLKREHPQTPVLGLVDHGDIPAAVQAMKAGATHCFQKPIETERLIAAIGELLDEIDSQSPMMPLTPMEMTVLRHIAQGKTSRQIAKTLHRSPRTIEVHRRHIMRKLHASTIVDLVRAACAMGLLGPPDHPSSGPARVSA
jgi:two-component system response regulator FixJ